MFSLQCFNFACWSRANMELGELKFVDFFTRVWNKDWVNILHFTVDTTMYSAISWHAHVIPKLNKLVILFINRCIFIFSTFQKIVCLTQGHLFSCIKRAWLDRLLDTIIKVEQSPCPCLVNIFKEFSDKIYLKVLCRTWARAFIVI